MYDIIFICEKCGAHLSADENDVGITLPCPDCSQIIAIPTGDILFDCPECGKNLLASKNSGDQLFHCPGCESSIAIPRKGKAIKLSNELAIPGGLTVERPGVTVTSPNTTSPRTGPTADTTDVDNNTDRQFMTTWGDYLAASGLAEEDKKKKR